MMEAYKEVVFRENIPEKFEMDILSRNLCSLFLAPGISVREDGIRFLYHTEGWMGLRDLVSIDVCTALEIMTVLLEKISAAEKIYFFEGEYLICPENFYVRINNFNEKKDGRLGMGGYSEVDVRLVYYKCISRNKKEILYKGLLSITEVLRELVKEGSSYMEKAEEIIRRGRSSTGVLKHRFFMLQKEASACML